MCAIISLMKGYNDGEQNTQCLDGVEITLGL